MTHDFINVQRVFDKYRIIYVPYYQRDYVWGSKNSGRNLYKFIDDIFTQYNKDASTDYFIGTLAFCSAQVNDVIDGQQRLTSLILILSVLSNLKCSKDIKDKHNKLLMPEADKFVLQEEYYLTEEIKYNLGLPNKFNSHGYSVDISKTIDRIKSQIERAWNTYTTQWYDGLYRYILEKVKFISLEYNNIGESLKYFLNINSLSIQLTQSDVFFSILSQALKLSGTAYSIFSLKQKVVELGKFKGIAGKEIEGYKSYDANEEKGVDNVIAVFLFSFYQNDSNIIDLNETGVGKWMSFYKNEVFNDPIKALDFVNKFVAYLNDFETIYKYLSNMGVPVKPNSSLYLTWILLQYENYFDILATILRIFKNRHNYIDGQLNLYETGTFNISFDKLNEIGKRLNLTLLKNYVKSGNKRLDSFVNYIEVDSSGTYKVSINDILTNITINDIFNLNYNDKKEVSNVKISDTSRIVKIILAVQESYLNSVANPTKDLSEYLENILTANSFTIEHLYSVNEWKDKDRLKVWRDKKGKFFDDSDFDTERFSFANLSLLDVSTNTSCSDDPIKTKLEKYKLARRVCGSEWEYLIQSLVEDSEFYKNSNISKLGLPKRTLEHIDQNTWELSPNNREFNIELLKKALEEIASKL